MHKIKTGLVPVAAAVLLLSSAGAATAATPSKTAQAAYDRMSEQERVGQLFLIGVDANRASKHVLSQLRADRAGNVYLSGRSRAGRTHTAAVVRTLRSRTTHAGVAPWVGADQEGGEVQVLTGRGFSSMPTGLAQGRLSTKRLTADARRWGRQLRAAGLNLDLAPVADTVPRRIGTCNAPIGRFHRQFGYDSRRVRSHVVAFANGMHAAGIATATKHFPGLGRASGNTDIVRRVTDPTTATSAYLKPFAAAVAAGTQFVMMSSAIYPHIDAKNRACFSSVVINTLLRGKQHFDGIVVSDSFSARSVSFLAPGQRAVRFLTAGGTMVLDADPSDLHPMVTAVRARMAALPSFARLVRADVLRVLTAKARAGLIG